MDSLMVQVNFQTVEEYELAVMLTSLRLEQLVILAESIDPQNNHSARAFIRGALWIPLEIAQRYHRKMPEHTVRELIELANAALAQAIEHIAEWKLGSLQGFLTRWICHSLDEALAKRTALQPQARKS